MMTDAVANLQHTIQAGPGTEVDARTLAGEHALLLRDCRRRVAPILTLAAARSWPEAELRGLTGFLRTAVLRQASDEEVLLYPNGAAAPFAELSTEHVQLYGLIDQLDQLERASCPLTELARLVNQTLTVLEHHLISEQAVLAELPDAPEVVPAAADLATGTQDWLPAGDEPVLILLDVLPPQRATQLCIERLLRLRPGQSAQIHSDQEADLQRVCRWMHSFDSADYGISRVQIGLTPAPLQIICRHAG
ncbi:MAG: hemerythrin domain-containing protein [Jatrophihabitantaceae bacterium]